MVGVVASFYPLAFVVEAVGAEHVTVANLTPSGVEPHDLELTPQDVVSLESSDLVVYLDGFSPALDEAAGQLDAGHLFDVSEAARLDLETEHEDEGVDPHFWLDPTRLADVSDAIATRLGELDQENADTYAENAAVLRAQLLELDQELEVGLASCSSIDLVTSHEAFGYLAQRYGLVQLGIAGLSPDVEPTPSQLAEVTDFVRENDVATIYYETLVDPAIAESIALETGAATAVLDPIEGLTDESAGRDYVEVMRSNLANLRVGQGCP